MRVPGVMKTSPVDRRQTARLNHLPVTEREPVAECGGYPQPLRRNMQFAGSRDGGWVYTEHELEVQNENVGAYIRFPAYGGSMKLLAFSALVLSLLAVSARAGTISYGSAGAFAVLGVGGVTNTGPSLIYGDLAGSTGTYEITGFPPGAVVAPAVIFPAGAGAAIGEPFYDALAA